MAKAKRSRKDVALSWSRKKSLTPFQRKLLVGYFKSSLLEVMNLKLFKTVKGKERVRTFCGFTQEVRNGQEKCLGDGGVLFSAGVSFVDVPLPFVVENSLVSLRPSILSDLEEASSKVWAFGQQSTHMIFRHTLAFRGAKASSP